MKPIWKPLLVALLAAGLVAGLIFGFRQGHKEVVAEVELEKPLKAPTRVEAVNGENVVTLNPAEQSNAGIVLASLETTERRPQIQAYGQVVDLQELTDLRRAFETATAQLRKAVAAVAVARQDYERVGTLYGKSQNISEKVFQAAEGTLRAEEANAQAAQAALDAVQAVARQHWGGVLADWLAQGTPEFEQLSRQKDLLVQVTLPAGQAALAAPSQALLQPAGGRRLNARLVSPAPRTDPRIQGRSFFYLVSAEGGDLLPGMNATALLPVGEPAPGAIVPASAVVWLQGKAWAYAQLQPGRFVRREVSTAQPVDDGWFQSKDFAPGEMFVVKGQQALLSEEFRAQIAVGEEQN